MATITVEDAAKRMARSTARVRKLLAEGRIEGEKVGRDWVIDEERFEAWRLSTNKVVPAHVRRAVIERDNDTCQDCKTVRASIVHHILERENGGSNEPDNLISLCPTCHSNRHRDGHPQHWRLNLQRELPEQTLLAIEDLAQQLNMTTTEVVIKAVNVLELRMQIAKEAALKTSSEEPSTLPIVASAVIPSTLPRVENRAEREKRERQERAQGLDSVDDPSIDRSDEYVSG